ncbi:MAG: replication-relaxation family protein [Actinomycetota bacterium]|nr:replication-relaxation family protein [Actinomycetota bacterium]
MEDRTHFSKLHALPRKVPNNRSAEFLLEVSTSIQPRDTKICLALYNHRVLTTHHIKELFFENDRVCRRRLERLRELGLVKPFRPRKAQGSYPNHHVLGDLGVYVVAAELGTDVKALGLRKDRMTKIAFSPKLQHQLSVNSFFTKLAWECRHGSGIRLTSWRSELQLAKGWWEGYSIADGEAKLWSAYGKTSFLLELDMGTESPQRIDRKLFDYGHFLEFGAYEYHWLLFCFPDASREASFHRNARHDRTWVASTTLDRHMGDPLGINWLPLLGEERYALPYLPAIPSRERPVVNPD